MKILTAKIAAPPSQTNIESSNNLCPFQVIFGQIPRSALSLFFVFLVFFAIPSFIKFVPKFTKRFPSAAKATPTKMEVGSRGWLCAPVCSVQDIVVVVVVVEIFIVGTRGDVIDAGRKVPASSSMDFKAFAQRCKSLCSHTTYLHVLYV